MRKRREIPYKLVEECFYAKKYLPGKMKILAEKLDDMFPRTSRDVVKLQTSTKTPYDTSITERWGIKRATCAEAMEYESKRLLLKYLDLIINDALTVEEALFVNHRYDREMRFYEIARELHTSERSCYRIRDSVLKKAWGYLRLIEQSLSRALN